MTLLLLLALCMVAPLYSQEISPDDFYDAEWKMKSEIFQMQKDHQTDNLALTQDDFDVLYWRLDVETNDIVEQLINGEVIMTSRSLVNGLTNIEYNFNSPMVTEEVTVNDVIAVFNHAGNILNITLDRPYNTGELITTVIVFSGHPTGGGFSWSTHNGVPIISTLSEPEGAREWWPCKDTPSDKADSADVYLHILDTQMGTSNGTLISNIDNGDGTRTVHWKESHPITTYLISLAVTNYQDFTDYYTPSVGDPMPITNYVYPEHYANAVEDFNITAQAIGVYAGLFGEYPFIDEKYGHSEFPWGGAMEHQCNTSYGASLIRGDHAYDWILVHELGHQWFGDMITCDTWPDIWMNEGFASYLEALYTEQTQNLNAYLNYMTGHLHVSDPSGPIYNPNPLFGSNTVYHKGAWVLHILRGVMGDQAFFDGMYGYANHPDHQYGTITTAEFRDIMAGYYGADLTWFFDEWVWGMNRPVYEYSWLAEDIGSGQYELFLHIDQTQVSPAPSVFTMPIKMYTTISSVESEFTVWNDNTDSDYRQIIDGNPSQVQLDKYNWILRTANQVPYTMHVVTESLPVAGLVRPYSGTIESRGGQLPYSFAITSGALPGGLTLDYSTGEITGTPTAQGDYAFTIQCVDSSDPPFVDSRDLSITVACLYLLGDYNGDNLFNVTDIVNGFSNLKTGTPVSWLQCECPFGGGQFWAVAMDVNNSCTFNVSDIVDGFSKLKTGQPILTACDQCGQ